MDSNFIEAMLDNTQIYSGNWGIERVPEGTDEIFEAASADISSSDRDFNRPLRSDLRFRLDYLRCELKLNTLLRNVELDIYEDSYDNVVDIVLSDIAYAELIVFDQAAGNTSLLQRFSELSVRANKALAKIYSRGRFLLDRAKSVHEISNCIKLGISEISSDAEKHDFLAEIRHVVESLAFSLQSANSEFPVARPSEQPYESRPKAESAPKLINQPQQGWLNDKFTRADLSEADSEGLARLTTSEKQIERKLAAKEYNILETMVGNQDGALLEIKKKVKEFWVPQRGRASSERPSDFIKRVYRDWIGENAELKLNRSYLLDIDSKLYYAYATQIRRNPKFDLNLPTNSNTQNDGRSAEAILQERRSREAKRSKRRRESSKPRSFDI